MTVQAPTAGRPARGFGTLRAQKWILAAALVTAITYAFRLLVEPSLNTAPARGGKVARMLGTGSPPPPLAQWAVAYGAGFLMLAIISLGAPEFAASVAMLELAGVVLTSGTSIVADLTGLEGKHPTPTTSTAVTTPPSTVPTTGPAAQSLAAIAQQRQIPVKDL